MNLEDALGGWPSDGSQQPPNPPWHSGPSGGGGAFPGGPSGGGGAFPGGPSGGGGAWPVGPSGGGGAWPAGPSGGGGAWPAGPSGGGGAWPVGPSGGGGAFPVGPSGGGGVWPSPQPSAPGPGPGPGPGSASAQNLGVPFTQVLPRGVYDKLLITITGTIKPNADKITVDLAASRDIAFHFNPRFNDHGKKVIVRNSYIGSKWGVEERELRVFPFNQGQPFEMKILCTNNEFKVAVNGSHLLDYKHRFKDLRSIKSLGIYNDLSLSGVLVETIP